MAQRKKWQTIQWPREKMTDNTMAQRKNNRQYNGPVTKNGSLDTTEKTKDWVTGTLLRTGGLVL
jgi:hypothetical protein